jgi:peptidoglycan/xylan/chitin deacetylase (PgdA/CDA1 family)
LSAARTAKRISPKKVTAFTILVGLIFFELGVMVGLGIQVGYSIRQSRTAVLKESEISRSLPFITIANAKESEEAFFASASDYQSQSDKKINLPVLMYHRIDTGSSDRIAAGLTVSPKNFESQVKYLADNGFNTVSLSDAYRALHQNISLPTKSVVLTFDDGYEDNYNYAFPILKKYNKAATFFVITGAIGNKAYLNKEQIKEMSAAGMAIESHTVDHLDLATTNVEKLTYELGLSRKRIKELTGKDSYFLAYPYGSYTKKVETISRGQGYLLAVTTAPGKEANAKSPFETPRLRVNPTTTIKEFATLVN